MSYYSEKKRVNSIIDTKIKGLDKDDTLDVNLLTLHLTGQYEVSAKAITERVKMWVDLDDTLELYKDRFLKRV